MSASQDCSQSEEQKNIASDNNPNNESKGNSLRENQSLPASEQHDVALNNELGNEDTNAHNNQSSEISKKRKITSAVKEKCSSGGGDSSSAKKKRAPCPWQVHPPPRPFKKARYAWQIKNYEHTVSRMKKAVAQQQQQQQQLHHQQAGQSSSSYSRSSITGNDAVDDPGDSTRPGLPGTTHYPGIYSNLQTPYNPNFYNNPLMRWSKLAASSVDSPVNRMLQNLFFSGNEPPPDLHSLLMLSLAEGNAAALTENMNCEELPSNLPVEALSAALMPQSQLHQQSALHHPSSNLSSPGMQSPPTSDYDSSSDDASLGDDIVPEPQVMPSHLPPSSYQQHLQHVGADRGQHHPSYGPGAQQCQANCPGGACPLYPRQDCDLQNAIPASRKLFLQHQQNLEQSHFNSPENTNASIMFQNAMMNCPIGMTNRNLFNFQLQSFCERMQASNALLPFHAYQQHFPPNTAHLAEYVDSQDEDGDSSPAELPLRRNFSPPGGDAEPMNASRDDAESDAMYQSQERTALVGDAVACRSPVDSTERNGVISAGEAAGSGDVRPVRRNSEPDNVSLETVEEPRPAIDVDQSSGAGDTAGEDDVVAATDPLFDSSATDPLFDSSATAPQVDATDGVLSVDALNSTPVSGAHLLNSVVNAAREDDPACDVGNEATAAPSLPSPADAQLTTTIHSISESSDQATSADKLTTVTSGDSQCDSNEGTLGSRTDGGSQASSVVANDETRGASVVRGERVVIAESRRTETVSNAEGAAARKDLGSSEPDETELPSSPDNETRTCESPSVVGGEKEPRKTAKVLCSPVTECSASSGSSVAAPVSVAVANSVHIGDTVERSDATAASLILNLSGEPLEEPACVGSPAISCSSECSRDGNSPKGSLVLTPKIGRNDCDSDSTEDTFSPSSFRSN